MKINNEQSIVEYLNHVRKRKTNSPPSAEEIETLISYLKTNGLDPIIVGALAVVSYLKPSNNNWPIADLTSPFLLKLNSFRDKDLFDLVVLANKVGIPHQLKNKTLNETQRNNLETVQLYLEHKDLLT